MKLLLNKKNIKQLSLSKKSIQRDLTPNIAGGEATYPLTDSCGTCDKENACFYFPTMRACTP